MMRTVPDGHDVVATAEATQPGQLAPLLILDVVTHFLDEHGLGSGPLEWSRIGEGQSNITYRIRRGGRDLVLRRGPRPPLPASTHDMRREAKIQRLLRPHGIPVPEVLAVCDDETLLGVPFYVMEYLAGVVITDAIPPELNSTRERRNSSLALARTLADLHRVDVTTGGLASFGRPEGFLDRQISRFAALWDISTSRTLGLVELLAEWLSANRPTTQTASVVHGDYRLGNLMFRHAAPASVIAVLDWEMATIGDPLTDVGYLTATYTDRENPQIPLHLSPVTARDGYLTSEELTKAYAERSGLDLSALPWYEALALWKAAIFCEAIYTRWLRGERSDDTFGPSLEAGVPALLSVARIRAQALK